MKFSFFIAFRYLFSKKSTNAINVISAISMIGMGLGAMALIVVLSVFNGFEKLVLELQNSFYSDIEVTPSTGKVFIPDNGFKQKIEEIKGVAYASYVLEENAYLRHKSQSTLAMVKGVDEAYYKVTDVDDYKVAGSDLLEFKGVNYAYLGAGLDYKLGTNVNMAMQPISISIPKRGKSNAMIATQLFNSGNVMPGGVFGIQSEFDNNYLFVSIAVLREIMKYDDEVSALEIKAEDGTSLEYLKNDLQLALGDAFNVKARYEQDEALYQIMKLERYGVIAILGLILLIISFNIVGSLSMLAMEKKKDNAILKSMGASSNSIRAIYLLEGILGALIGAVVGVLLGLLIVGAQYYFGLISLGGGGFVVESYPVEMHVSDIVLTFALVLGISILASWYPAKRAAAQDLIAGTKS